MPNTHCFNGLSHAHGLGGGGGERLSCIDAAEFTGTGTNVSQDHERSGSGAPAFADVRAVAGYTDGIQVLMIDQPTYLLVRFALFQPRFQIDPAGQASVFGFFHQIILCVKNNRITSKYFSVNYLSINQNCLILHPEI
jgi:hypothetical protein